MRRSFRVMGLVAVLAAVAVAVQAGMGAAGRSSITVEIIAPPPNVTLPAGQAVEVRYRVTGPAGRAELWCDDTLLATDATQAGQELIHAWIPTDLGAACCIVQARDERNAVLASARRCLTVEPDGSPVRLKGP